MLNPDVRRVLDGTSLGHLATVLPDSSPHSTPVFVGTRDDQLIFFRQPIPAGHHPRPGHRMARGRHRVGNHRPDRDEVHRPALYPRQGTHRRRRRARPADHRYRLNRPA